MNRRIIFFVAAPPDFFDVRDHKEGEFWKKHLFQVGEETLLELNHLFSGSALEMAQSR